MVLIKSISGIRGTLENIPGESLSDYDLKQFILAYIFEVIKKENSNKIVVGRDARRSGIRISNIVINILLQEGIDVVDIGLVTTPTLGISVKQLKAAGGIMISASHNDERWNALKLLKHNGEFLSPKSVALIIKEVKREFSGNCVKGNLIDYKSALQDHIDLIIFSKQIKYFEFLQNLNKKASVHWTEAFLSRNLDF